jgi:S1-C subfamily serine protease
MKKALLGLNQVASFFMVSIGIIILSVIPVYATNEDYEKRWDHVRLSGVVEPGQRYSVSSGTGFYVTRSYVLTNAHVVESCRRIAWRGAVWPQYGRVVAVDAQLDLALLTPIQADDEPKQVALLRANRQEIMLHEEVFMIGYPLEAGQHGMYQLLPLRIERIIQDEQSKIVTQLYMSSGAEHGNSGGPLLDRGGQVVGVVTAKIHENQRRYFASGSIETVKTNYYSMAIGVDPLIEFLRRHRIYYQQQTTYDIFTDYRPDRRAKHFIVNIHCVR